VKIRASELETCFVECTKISRINDCSEKDGKGKGTRPQFSDGVNLVSGSIEGVFFCGRHFFPTLILFFSELIHRGIGFPWIHLMFRYIPGN